MTRATEGRDETKKPLLIYDGDCGFCSYWVEYWRGLTGARVRYEPYQSVGRDFPQISEEDFKGAVQFIEPDGTWSGKGAKASYKVLSYAPGRGFWLWMYERIPGFAPITECAYSLIAKRRSFFYDLSLLFWGRDHQPETLDLVAALFMRLLGIIFLSVFLSFAVQADILIGENGLLPLNEFTAFAKERLGGWRFYSVPFVFWFNDSDLAIHIVAWGGAFLSSLLVFGIWQRWTVLIVTLFYLSLIYAGQRFMTFQWDFFLVEVGFIAFVLTFARGLGVWLLRYLMFRFMFVSGIVKIASGDVAWWNLSALNYHFETQPLPTPLAYYAHHLPEGLLAFGTVSTLFIEIIVPFLVFTPRRMRFVAAGLFVLLQGVILITGNYNFFNLLSIVVCLALLDDRALRWLAPDKIVAGLQRIPTPAPSVRGMGKVFVIVFAVWTVSISLIQFNNRLFEPKRLPIPVQMIDASISPLRAVSTYGPFPVMTKTRPEIIIEGSDDGQVWREYEFKYKPGDVMRGTGFNIPHQPRVDWQLWFAAMDRPERNPWFGRLMQRLLEGTPEVKRLFRVHPFPDAPPRYVRAVLYDYTFAPPEKRRASGQYWERTRLGLYFPPTALNNSINE